MTEYTMTSNSTNYAAEVVEVRGLHTLPGLDNLVGIHINGYQALVSKDTSVGDKLLVFPAECQISEDFARAHNLMRDQGGYLEANRRVRAIKLRGHVSNALALAMSDLPAVGTVFDTIDGVQIVRKYEIPVKVGRTPTAQPRKERRVDERMFPQHVDTENYWRNAHKIPDGGYVTVTQKLHGTSWRATNAAVKRKLSWLERLARWVGIKVTETEYVPLFGSRKVIKDPTNPDQNHYYDTDLWTEYGMTVADRLPKDVVVYGELVGWAGDGPIQQNYTYDVPKGQVAMYVYRVTTTTTDGHHYDLPWHAVETFCEERGFKTVPVLWAGLHKDFVVDEFVDKVFWPQYANAVPLSKDSPVDEGVVVRYNNEFYKAKGPIFFGHETALLDKGLEILS